MDQKTGGGKAQSAENNRKTDGKFDKKQVKHDPQAESARVKFGKEPQA
jgi:hypothetical protein